MIDGRFRNMQIDYAEVDRQAHELAHSHGPRAHLEAARLSKAAEATGGFDEAKFWQAVEASLKPR